MDLAAGRVAFFLPSLEGGGVERCMHLLANKFVSRGIVVDLLLVKKEGPYLNTVLPAVRIVDLGAGRLLRSLPGLIRYLRAEKPACVISAMTHTNIVAALAHFLANSSAKLVLTEHITLKRAFMNAPSLRDRLLPLLIACPYQRADHIIAVSRGVADQLRTFGAPSDRISVIYNPVVSSQILKNSEQPIDHPWFQADAPPVIVGVGRLTPQKDFATLLRAVALAREHRALHLLILGEGTERARLQAIVQQLGLADVVGMPGYVENPYKYMERASLFVLSSKFEGLPTALIEAMACGAPVVSTDCQSGPREILENGRWGRLVPCGDPVALAAAISATLDEKAHPDVKARAAAFDIDGAAQRYLEVLFGVGSNTGEQQRRR